MGNSGSFIGYSFATCCQWSVTPETATSGMLLFLSRNCFYYRIFVWWPLPTIEDDQNRGAAGLSPVNFWYNAARAKLQRLQENKSQEPVDMPPIVLKRCSDCSSQTIVDHLCTIHESCKSAGGLEESNSNANLQEREEERCRQLSLTSVPSL